jgi:hypothetical protein
MTTVVQVKWSYKYTIRICINHRKWVEVRSVTRLVVIKTHKRNSSDCKCGTLIKSDRDMIHKTTTKISKNDDQNAKTTLKNKTITEKLTRIPEFLFALLQSICYMLVTLRAYFRGSVPISLATFLVPQKVICPRI